MQKLKLLYVDDEKANLTNFRLAFKRHYDIFTAASGAEALETFSKEGDFVIVVSDQRMPGMTGVELLEEIIEIAPDVIRIILTAYTDVADIIDSINLGKIYQYVVKPWKEDEMLGLLAKASDMYRLVQENRRLLVDLDSKNRELEEDIVKRKQIQTILLKRDMCLGAVSDIARRLIVCKGWQDFIDELLARLGMVMAVGRAHVFQHHLADDGDLLVSQKFEWVAEGVASVKKDPGYQNISFKKDGFQRWPEILCRGECIHGNVADFPVTEKEWFIRHDTYSVANTPIMTGEKCWGFLAFQDCLSEREWPAAELDALHTAASFIGAVILAEEMETSLAAQQAQLAHAGRLTAMGEMASGMGHEMHQPLTVITLGAETCRDYFKKHDPHSPVADAAEDIRVHARKIANLITNMRSFSRVSSGEMKKISLFWPLCEALTFFREQFRLVGIELVENLTEGVPPVLSDAQKFEQIVVNFLSNARYAVEKRAENDSGYQKRIKVSLIVRQATEDEWAGFAFKKAQTCGQIVVFAVRDNGIGMSEEVRKKCLEPFFTTKEVGQGTGLGLSVTHGIIRELNMHLAIDSREGEGSSFTVFVPVADEDA